MQIIRSIFFSFFFYSGIIIICIVALPSLFMPSKVAIFFGRILGHYIVLILRIFLNSKVVYHGTENLKKFDKFFLASAHQSILETFILQVPIDGPIFILKNELLKIPIFGSYLKKIGSISIIRDTITKENLDFNEKLNQTLKNLHRPLLIFPQGTRVKFDEKIPFKKGVGRIYQTLNLPCVPVALNSGQIWPKNSFLKNSTDMHISFLDPIIPGKSKDEFLNELEIKIYKEVDKLI